MPVENRHIGNAPTIARIAEEERECLHRQVLSSVSHDLKTPLASIIGSLEVYERVNERLSKEQKESLIALALQEAYRLDAFITNILDMARLENKMVKRRVETIVVRTLLEDCMLRFGHRLKGSDVHIETVADFLKVAADHTLLNRVVCLLLDNAVKYGGTPAIIRIGYGRRQDDQIFIRVADNGPGIPEGNLEAIFCKYTRFVRGDQQNAGTGLGLAICREIMSLLQGSIVAANGIAGGATFTLLLPAA